MLRWRTSGYGSGVGDEDTDDEGELKRHSEKDARSSYPMPEDEHRRGVHRRFEEGSASEKMQGSQMQGGSKDRVVRCGKKGKSPREKEGQHDPWDWKSTSQIKVKTPPTLRRSASKQDDENDRHGRRHGRRSDKSHRRYTSPSSSGESSSTSPEMEPVRRHHYIKTRIFDGSGSFETF